MVGQLPSHARVVVIGGGVMGCRTLYHLAKLGVCGSVLLEGKQQSGQSTGCVRTGSLSIATNAAECSLRAHLEKMVESGRFQVELASERHDVEVSLSPLFDPSGARMRADT